jgi:1-phosphatidylinositol-3-phosphate 5-kinase
LETEWLAAKESEKLYRETLKEDYPKNETYEYCFSIYYHREF